MRECVSRYSEGDTLDDDLNLQRGAILQGSKRFAVMACTAWLSTDFVALAPGCPCKTSWWAGRERGRERSGGVTQEPVRTLSSGRGDPLSSRQGRSNMILGAHVIIYTKDADADRAFIRDVLGFSHIDVGGGWLIFGLPPAEVAVHPTDGGGSHELYLMCDDVAKFRAEMAGHGVSTSGLNEQRWGVITDVQLPSGAKLSVYEPRHPRPEPMRGGAAVKSAGKKASAKPATSGKPPGKSPAKLPAKAAGKSSGKVLPKPPAKSSGKPPAKSSGKSRRKR